MIIKHPQYPICGGNSSGKQTNKSQSTVSLHSSGVVRPLAKMSFSSNKCFGKCLMGEKVFNEYSVRKSRVDQEQRSNQGGWVEWFSLAWSRKASQKKLAPKFPWHRPPQLIGINARDCPPPPPQPCTEEEGHSFSAPDWFRLLSSALIGAKLHLLH